MSEGIYGDNDDDDSSQPGSMDSTSDSGESCGLVIWSAGKASQAGDTITGSAKFWAYEIGVRQRTSGFTHKEADMLLTDMPKMNVKMKMKLCQLFYNCDDGGWFVGLGLLQTCLLHLQPFKAPCTGAILL